MKVQETDAAREMQEDQLHKSIVELGLHFRKYFLGPVCGNLAPSHRVSGDAIFNAADDA